MCQVNLPEAFPVPVVPVLGVSVALAVSAYTGKVKQVLLRLDFNSLIFHINSNMVAYITIKQERKKMWIK